MLLSHGADIDALNGAHQTALLAQAQIAHVRWQVILELIAAGSDVNVLDKSGRDTLGLIREMCDDAYEKRADIAQRLVVALIVAGAKPESFANRRSPLLSAAASFHCFSLLLGAGANVLQQDIVANWQIL